MISTQPTLIIDRIEELKQALRMKRRLGKAANSHIHWYYLEGFTKAIDEPFEIREAKARLHFYRNVPIEILPGEAIVGQIDWNEPFTCLFSNTQIRQNVLEKIDTSSIPEDQMQHVQEMIELSRPFCFDPMPHLTEEERLVHQSHLAPSTFFNGHMVPDFSYLLERGFQGLLEDVQRARSRPLTQVERNYYDAMEITIQGLSEYIQRYALLARECQVNELEGYAWDQLERAAGNCQNVAWAPARTFPEALQLMWFWMCFMDYDSFGRADQYLLPSYERSREAGMTDEEALLWLKYNWIKIEECGAILNMTIGGRKPDGSSAVNPLTYLILQATLEMGFRSPNLALRIRAEDPDELWSAAHLTLSSGQGLPALYNDDLIVSMLSGLGYSDGDALDFCLAGCSQVVLPGRSNFACDVGCYNLAKALELALHDGYDILLQKQVGPRTGKPDQLNSFDALKKAYHRQMRFMTRMGVSINDKDTYMRQREGACVRSLGIHDCIKRGRGVFHGGARFYNIQNEACGITNAANSLYAIKKFIFEDQVLSLTDLVRILDKDWEGQETLRLRFKNRCDKFGNDRKGIDRLRGEISRDWYQEIQQYPGVLGGFHWPGEVVFVYHEIHGSHTAASPDGRKAGEPLANSAGATSGTDLAGPTGLLNSMVHLPQEQCLTCCVLNMRFMRKVWVQNSSRIVDLLRTYFTQGGFQVQIDLVSQEDLLAARQDPEKYADLIVRVGGFSDYFVRLPEKLQVEILERTAHELSE